MPTYRRLNSDHASPEIRLCVLLPAPAAAAEEPIRCLLTTAGLGDDDERRGYEALSYVWGERHDCEAIEVDGQPFAATKNLAAALFHLRGPSEPRTLWVDAICINQDDVEERSQQVALMGQIYRRADRVVSWLGLADPLAAAAGGVDPVEEMGYAREFVEHVRFLDGHAPLREYLENPDPGADYPELEKQVELFNIGLWSFQVLIGERSEYPSYWERAWITQEVVQARSWVIQTGFDTIAEEDMMAVVEFMKLPSIDRLMEGRYGTRVLAAKIQQRMVVPASLYRVLCSTEANTHDSREAKFKDSGFWPLASLLRRNRSRLCRDPRDKVYSVLGISDLASKSHPGLSIDYTHSVSQVYTDVVQAIVELTSCLDVLYSIKENPVTQGLPSWVPDWNQEQSMEAAEQPVSYGNQAASGDKVAKFSFTGGDFAGAQRTLTTTGFCFGTVAALRNQFVTGGSETLADKTSEPYILLQKFYKFHKGLLVAFQWAALAVEPRRLSRDRFQRTCAVGLLDHQLGDSYREFMDTLILDRSWEDVADSLSRISGPGFGFRYRAMIRAVDEQCLFTAQPTTDESGSSTILGTDGIIGIGPAGSIEQGDLICVILGCSAPLILRRTSQGRFSIVAPVYVDCLMDGKAISSVDEGNLQSYVIE